MKREGHLYLIIGLIVMALAFLQFGPFTVRPERLESAVKKIDVFKQLLVNVKCNIYFVQGEEQGIVYEGPGNLVKNIRIDVQDGCITIRKLDPGLKGFLFGWMDPVTAKPLNVYIVVHDIHTVETGGKPEMIVLDNLKNNRIIFPVQPACDNFEM